MAKPYSILQPALNKFDLGVAAHLQKEHMHLDPDFAHLTYGDKGERGKQLKDKIQTGDKLVFYSGLMDVNRKRPLVYAIIGLFVVGKKVLATEIKGKDRDTNAHSRRILERGAQDLVIRARPGVSGRLKKCSPIGDFREGAYLVLPDLLEEWGGLSVKNGYLQRSARLPEFCDPARFLKWLKRQEPLLMQANN